jgi:hypothetical protein
MNPTRTDPIPQLTHLLPKRARPYPTLYRSLHIILRCGSDPIRSEAGAYTPSAGLCPILSDPIPELIPPSSGMNPNRTDPIPQLTHLLPKRARPYPTLYRSLYIIFRCGSDPIRSDAGADTSSTGLYPILSDPIPKLIHRIRVALSPIKSQRRSVRLRCDSIDLLYDFYITTNDPL